MSEISATNAAQRFTELLDDVEHRGERFTIVRGDRAVAHLEPALRGRGADVKSLLREYRPDERHVQELREIRDLLESDSRA